MYLVFWCFCRCFVHELLWVDDLQTLVSYDYWLQMKTVVSNVISFLMYSDYFYITFYLACFKLTNRNMFK